MALPLRPLKRHYPLVGPNIWIRKGASTSSARWGWLKWRVCRIWNRWWNPWHTFFLRWSTVVASFGLLDLKLIRKSCSRPGYKPISPCTIWADWTVLSMSWPSAGRLRSRAAGLIRWCDPRGCSRRLQTVLLVFFDDHLLDDHPTWKLGSNHSSIIL